MLFRDLPIRTKITLVAMLTTVLSLVLACAGFIINDQIAFKRDMAQNLAIVGRIVAANTMAPLVFNDQSAAEESLLTLSEKNHVMAAAVYTRGGTLFARYLRDDQDQLDIPLVQEDRGPVFTENSLVVAQSVNLDNEHLGTVYIKSDLDELQSRTRWYIGVALFILVSTTLLGILISFWLQRFISAPILNLAHTVRTITRDKNYDIRGEKYGQDEIGDLIDGFNEMLTQIQVRDAKLDQHRELLEIQVEKRTQELKRTNEKLLDQIQERERAERALLRAQKMDAVGTLAGGIAHDFNNLLQSVRGYADLLMMKKNEQDPDYRELREILRATRRASDLTQRLLTFSRSIDSQLKPVDLNHEVVDSRKLLESTIPKMITIELKLASNLRPINADPAQLDQIIVNLALNARDAMPEGGTLAIATRNIEMDEEFCKGVPDLIPGPYVKLSISDTGTGMSRETLEHVFEPFYTTKEPGKGTGLGLAMVYGIVVNHKGHITCRSKPGQGTTFDMFFPALEQEEIEVEDGEHHELPKEGTETILLVDDEEPIRELGGEILAEFGYKVLLAENGERGLEIFTDNQADIDLVILDVIMPGMGGKKCLERLLELEPEIKVLITSGYFVDGETRTVLENGSRGFIRKPYDLHTLLEKVRKVLDDTSPST